jgi:hypothetical protein
MADLVTELGKLQYGKGLAETLAGIGRVYGESKRRQEAQNLISQYTKELFKPGATQADILGGPASSLYSQLMGTEEGQQQLQGLGSQAAGLQQLQGVQPKPVALRPGEQIFTPKTEGVLGKVTGYEPGPSVPKEASSHEVTSPIPDSDMAAQYPNLPRNMKLGNEQIKLQYQGYKGEDGKWQVVGKPEQIKGSEGSGAGQTPNATTWPGDWTKTGDEFLKSLPPQIQGLVKGYSDYSMTTQQLAAMGRGERAMYQAMAKQVNPSFDATQFDTRKKVRWSFTSGPDAKNVTSLNTVTGHLASLKKYGDALDNTASPPTNAVKNFLLQQKGDPRIKNFEAAATAVASELSNVFKGTATEQEIRAWRNNITPNMSPEMIRQSIDTIIQLMASRLQALGSKWEAGTGSPKDFKLLSPKSRLILQSQLGVDPNTIDPTGTQPEALPEEAPEETKTIGDKTYVKKNGKWYTR